MRIVGFKVKCDRFIMVSGDRITGDCLLKEASEREDLKSCKIDENCKLPERIRRFVSTYISS
jgi:hypothetical protein